MSDTRDQTTTARHQTFTRRHFYAHNHSAVGANAWRISWARGQQCLPLAKSCRSCRHVTKQSAPNKRANNGCPLVWLPHMQHDMRHVWQHLGITGK